MLKNHTFKTEAWPGQAGKRLGQQAWQQPNAAMTENEGCELK